MLLELMNFLATCVLKNGLVSMSSGEKKKTHMACPRALRAIDVFSFVSLSVTWVPYMVCGTKKIIKHVNLDYAKKIQLRQNKNV